MSELVDGVTKLSKINFTSKEDRQAENFRKMVVAMARDIRVLLIKLCDRLDNMRTLEHMAGDAQERIARETLEIYAPLANRLGIQAFKSELEDLSFKHLEPEAQADLVAQLTKTKKERDKYISEVCKTLSGRLAEQGFAAEVTGRAKHLYSVYRKMEGAAVRRRRRSTTLIAYSRRRRERELIYCAALRRHPRSQMDARAPGRFKDYRRPCRSRTCTSRSTRRSSGPGASGSRSRSGRTTCTASPSAGSPPTGSTRSAARASRTQDVQRFSWLRRAPRVAGRS